MSEDVPRLETARLLLTLPRPDDVNEMLAYAERNREHLAPWSPPPPAGAGTRGQFRDHVLTALTNHALVDAERLCTPVT